MAAAWAALAGVGVLVGRAGGEEPSFWPGPFDVKLDVVKQELSPDFCWFSSPVIVHGVLALVMPAGTSRQRADNQAS